MQLNVKEEGDFSGLSEDEIIRKAQEGLAVAFEHLYRRYSKRVYHLCLRMVKSDAEAEDLTQEVFLLVFRKIHTFQGKAAFSTWLHRVSVNTVLMSLRKRKRPEVPLENDDHDEEEPGPSREIPGAPDPSLLGLFDRENLKRALRQMPPGYRRALVLHDLLGYDHNEIALLAKRSAGNSKSQLHKARARMRTLLEMDRQNHPSAVPSTFQSAGPAFSTHRYSTRLRRFPKTRIL